LRLDLESLYTPDEKSEVVASAQQIIKLISKVFIKYLRIFVNVGPRLQPTHIVGSVDNSLV